MLPRVRATIGGIPESFQADYYEGTPSFQRRCPLSSGGTGWRQVRVKQCSSMFGITGPPPHTVGAPTRVPKNVWGQSCLLVKIRERSRNEPVESMHYAYKNWHWNCMTEIGQNAVIWPIILILWVGPILFFPNKAPTIVNPTLDGGDCQHVTD